MEEIGWEVDRKGALSPLMEVVYKILVKDTGILKDEDVNIS